MTRLSGPALRWLVLAWLGATLSGVAAAADEMPEWRYTVRPGDTLIGVCNRYLAQPAWWPRLQGHNRIQNPRRLVPGSALRIPLAWLRFEPAPAAVAAVSGQVSVIADGAAARPLKDGELLRSGARLVTAADSSATLRFADGSEMRVQPGTQVTLDSVSVYAGGGMVDTRVRLQQGRVEIGANPGRVPGSRLRVITPSAVAAVRGTRFRVAVETDLTREETLEGEVGVEAAGQQIGVVAGLGTLAERGQPPQVPVALLPAPDVSQLPARVDSLPMRFSVPPMPGATAWLGQIAADNDFDALLLEQMSSAPQLSFADLPDGRYVLRIRAADAKGLQGHDALHAFELDARPFAPLPIAPGRRVRAPQPEIQWSGVVGASAYRLQLAGDANFRGPIVDRTVTDIGFKLDAPLAPGGYHWRVASIDATGPGPFSAAQAFRFDPLPGAPDLAESAPAFKDDSLALRLPAPPAGLRYDVVLSRDAERSQVAWSGTSSDGAVRMAPVAAERYFLSARLVEADGTAGPYATRVIEAPPKRPQWEYLLILLPLLAL